MRPANLRPWVDARDPPSWIAEDLQAQRRSPLTLHRAKRSQTLRRIRVTKWNTTRWSRNLLLRTCFFQGPVFLSGFHVKVTSKRHTDVRVPVPKSSVTATVWRMWTVDEEPRPSRMTLIDGLLDLPLLPNKQGFTLRNPKG